MKKNAIIYQATKKDSQANVFKKVTGKIKQYKEPAIIAAVGLATYKVSEHLPLWENVLLNAGLMIERGFYLRNKYNDSR